MHSDIFTTNFCNFWTVSKYHPTSRNSSGVTFWPIRCTIRIWEGWHPYKYRTTVLQRHSQFRFHKVHIYLISKMDAFHQLMELIDPSTMQFDILKELPLEIANIILLKLDVDSLLNCALVCYKWLKICKSSKVLRRKIRNHIRRLNRKSNKENTSSTFQNSLPSTSQQFCNPSTSTNRKPKAKSTPNPSSGIKKMRL